MNVYCLVLLFTFFMLFATTLGASFVFFIKRMNATLEKVCLGLASGIMIAASIFSLLLPALEETNCFLISISILVGGFFLWILNWFCSFSKKIENHSKSFFFLAVTLHNIPEGMAVGLACSLSNQISSNVTLASTLALTFGIAIQNIPEGMAVSLTMLEQKKSRLKAFFYGFLSGIVEPIAGIFMVLLSKKIQNCMPLFLAMATGTMFYVVVDELIPSSKSEKNNSGVISFMIGFVIMLYLDVTLG